jgi:hypothetical protein
LAWRFNSARRIKVEGGAAAAVPNPTDELRVIKSRAAGPNSLKERAKGMPRCRCETAEATVVPPAALWFFGAFRRPARPIFIFLNVRLRFFRNRGTEDTEVAKRVESLCALCGEYLLLFKSTLN